MSWLTAVLLSTTASTGPCQLPAWASRRSPVEWATLATSEQWTLLAERSMSQRRHVQLLECRPGSARGTRVAGSRLWLLEVGGGALEVGRVEPGGERWLEQPTLSLADANGDGLDELHLRGTFRAGSDAHRVEGSALLVISSVSSGEREGPRCLPWDDEYPTGVVFVLVRGRALWLDASGFEEGVEFEVTGALDGDRVRHRFMSRETGAQVTVTRTLGAAQRCDRR